MIVRQALKVESGGLVVRATRTASVESRDSAPESPRSTCFFKEGVIIANNV